MSTLFASEASPEVGLLLRAVLDGLATTLLERTPDAECAVVVSPGEVRLSAEGSRCASSAGPPLRQGAADVEHHREAATSLDDGDTPQTSAKFKLDKVDKVAKGVRQPTASR